MRYRRLDLSGDYTFGQGSANFLVNSAACVAQSILTRLKLWEGEWFLDTSAGTPWLQNILGKRTLPLADLLIQDRVLSTENVTSIENYSSLLTPGTRKLTVTMDVNTKFGIIVALVATVAPTPPPPPPGAPSLDFSIPDNSMYLPGGL